MTVVVLASFAWALVYLAHCWWRPFRDCRRCNGKPRNYDSKGWRTFNHSCRWCGGTGSKRRWGSLLLGGGFGRL